LTADCPAEARTCLYTNSPAGDVVVAPVPGRARVVLAGLGSGHGFKLGPAMGRLAVEAVLGAAPTLPWPGTGERAVW
jgi:glycine/D-amino acid oxidase-like deaminating enzyme